MDPFVCEIRVFPFNFAPKGWAFCDGQLLPISQNTAVFSLLGTFYGGDGRSNFALPNLQGNVPIHQGQGAGLSDYFIGEQSGTESVTLQTSEVPNHTHGLKASTTQDSSTPSGSSLAQGEQIYRTTTANQAPMNFNAVSIVGGGFPHNNMMPYLILNFCIALQGVFPPRS